MKRGFMLFKCMNCGYDKQKQTLNSNKMNNPLSLIVYTVVLCSAMQSRTVDSRECLLVIIWLDAAHIMRGCGIQGLHEKLQGTAELNHRCLIRRRSTANRGDSDTA